MQPPIPPPVDMVWTAIEAYLAVAYPAGAVPAAVKARVTRLHEADAGTFYANDALSRE